MASELPQHRILLSETELRDVIARLACRINMDYQGENVVLLGLLEGCRPFFNALSAQLTFPIEKVLIKVSFYGAQFHPGNTPKLNVSVDALQSQLQGKNILIVDDMLDTGKTLQFVTGWVRHHFSPQKVQTCVMLNRIGCDKRIHADYVGYEFESHDWVIGAGLDPHRELPYVGLMPPPKD